MGFKMTENYELRLGDFGPSGFQEYVERTQDEDVYWMSLAWRGAPLMLTSGIWFLLKNAKEGLESLVKKN